MSLPLDSIAVSELKGVGPQLAIKLAKLGINSLQDVLFHLPMRYIDRTKITPIGVLQANIEAVIEAEVKDCDIVQGRRRSLACRIQDVSGVLTLRFFHFSNSQKTQLYKGVKIRCYGEVRRGANGQEIYHPEYQILDGNTPPQLESQLTPIYPTTEGLTQTRLRAISQQVVDLMNEINVRELLPLDIPTPAGRNRANNLMDALRYLHSPPANAPLDLLAEGEHPAQQQLVFEELMAHNLSLLRLRQQVQQQGAPALHTDPNLTQRFLAQLEFSLTAAQQRVSEEILTDLANPYPMLRLMQGDVGSGKTVVAAMAVLSAIASGKQAAVMAPTEILAEQHRNCFNSWLAPLGIRIAWLTGKLKGKGREAQLTAIEDGSAQVVIGTHALFQDDVIFNDLALTIIDEQHRFGVHQRLALREKGNHGGCVPHQLIMTATPIPRTLAMSAYADLDCSIIDQLPPGRSPVKTIAVAEQRRDQVMQRVQFACSQGRQAYWVCTLIEESDVLEAQAAESTYDELHLLLPNLRIGLIHGRLRPHEKEQMMASFKMGELDLLVATTVIEVGVDVPNASLMIIENPERLGLAQLHQLRGRVGRGSAESFCVLLYKPSLSQQGIERLRIMRETNDGFEIAEKDLQLRGPGEVLGTRQTGDIQMRIADLQRDSHLLTLVRTSSKKLIDNYPELVQPIINRWIPHGEKFGQV
jgi:ATP-dependent DNA helicase RecG